jgi:hypothetical protein
VSMAAAGMFSSALLGVVPLLNEGIIIHVSPLPNSLLIYRLNLSLCSF